ncbi:MAG: hypothetical protein F6K58_03200 [Symploca sp. SIO2E9]|nr:hypothetical protein [Symploca sp. SIO2E9]
MVKTPRLVSFSEYLKYDDDTDNRYELVEGKLVPIPPENEENDWYTLWLILLSA